MKPMGFPSRFRWWIVGVLAVLLGLPVLPMAAWFAWEMPPLHKWYLMAYLDSTRGPKEPVQPPSPMVFKAAPGRQHILVTDRDVVSSSDRKLPIQLSRSAIDDGWRGVEMSPPQQVNSIELKQFLQDDFYDGNGFWRVMEEPAAEAFGLLFIAIVPALALKGKFASRAKRESASRTPHEGAGVAFVPSLESPDKGRWHSAPATQRERMAQSSRNSCLDGRIPAFVSAAILKRVTSF